MYKIKRYFQGVWKQAKKVRWPKNKDLISAVSVVLVVVSFAAVCMMINDALISEVLKNLDKSFPNGTNTETSVASIKMIGNLFNL